jgi:archaellum component FlaC
MTQDYLGVDIDIGGVGDCVAEVDAKIHRIKEMYRAVKSSLAWELLGSICSRAYQPTAYYGAE